MAWDHLSINRPHLVYIILGGFTSLFMLCSSFIKERLYIGEATVATICGIIFGPHAANLIDPGTWGNVDQITLEFSRIVLVVQCFAVGVELPKYYMEKHWKSVIFLLLPVMTFGWLITSVFVWWMVPPLTWLHSLAVAACVTATDPVLASSVVGKGKFAKRVPKHLRDLLSAESGCNDGMAFPFIYLALYIIAYEHSPKDVAFYWIVVSVLYECVFGAIYGFVIGYIGRRGIRWAEQNDLVDRESFLVFYFVLALFCAGSGSILGVDDLLVGFAAGVGFSNDGWFTQKTEESHVSNVIDLLINLAYFVYFGTIIPWDQYNSPDLGLTPWRLVVIAVFVIFFRRIPIMMALKPIIPDIHTWREALFAGHFGPIGVGAIFVAILARADLETGTTTPLAELPSEDSPDFILIALVWPIVTFLVIASIIVHGSSIAVFTLGKHINTLTLTMSYTKATEDGPSWMNRLPRIQSQSKSMSKMSDTDVEDVKLDNLPPGTLPPVGMPGAFLRRQKEEDNPSRNTSRTSSLVSKRRKKNKWDQFGPGGPISQSAITPQRRTNSQNTSTTLTPEQSESHSNEEERQKDLEEINEGELGEVQHDPEMEDIIHDGDIEKKDQHRSDAERHPNRVERYREGDEIITENEDGEVISVRNVSEPEDTDKQEKNAQELLAEDAKADDEHAHMYKNLRKKLGVWRHKDDSVIEAGKDNQKKRGAALAYQFGNTIIVEDEDGEVVKKYELPPQRADRKSNAGTSAENEEDNEHHTVRHGLNRMGTWTGFGGKKEGKPAEASEAPRRTKKTAAETEDDDRRIRFTIGGAGRRMTKEDFLKEMQALDPKARMEIVSSSDAPNEMKELARKDALDNEGSSRLFSAKSPQLTGGHKEATAIGAAMAKTRGADIDTDEDEVSEDEGPDVPRKQRTSDKHQNTEGESSGSRRLAKIESPSNFVGETPAERRRREQALKGVEEEDDRAVKQTQRETPAERRRREATASRAPAGSSAIQPAPLKETPGLHPKTMATKESDAVARETGETPAEKRRREAALGVGGDEDDDSEDDNTARVPAPKSRGIRFAEDPVRGRK